MIRRVDETSADDGLKGVATVNAQERIIRDRFTRNTCANCGVYHTADDVLVLARRSRAWLVLVSCHECQRRGIFVVTFPRPAKSNNASPSATTSDATGELPPFTNDGLRDKPQWPELWQEPELRIERRAVPIPPQLPTPNQSFPAPTDSAATIQPDDLAAAPPSPPLPPTPPSMVNHLDVDAMRTFLSAFDGDFQRLFNLGNLGEQA